MTAAALATNSPAWTMPVIILFSRFGFAFLAQILVAGLFWALGDATPWQTAAGWWTIYTTLVDLGCLALLVAFTRREGIRLTDLIGFDRRRLGRDLAFALLVIVIVFPLAMVGTTGSAILILGASESPMPMAAGIPLGWKLYSLLVWPVIWGATEQLVYNGYTLPRLEALTGRKWLAVTLVMFGWALQHIALPFQADGPYLLFRFVQYIPLVVMPLLYMRTRRLLPFMIAHWFLDFGAAAAMHFLPS